MQNRPVIHKNELFRFFECKLTIEKTSIICDVSQKTVKQWDSGHPIPAYYEKTMKTYAGLDLTHLGWEKWRFEAGELVSPIGYRVKPDQLEYLLIMQRSEPDIRQSDIKKLRDKKRR